jgi:hypothetical protein
MASSNWTLQLDQVTDEGNAYFWGNNTAAYTHDIETRGRPPQYNFFVVDGEVEPFLIENSYGLPKDIFRCPRAEVWVFDHVIVPHPPPDEDKGIVNFELDPA